jgi:DNA-3-methyladenine glycosylase
MRKLRRSFYARPAIEVAPDLIGKILVHRVDNALRRARIVETEAYIGQHDLASHSSKGRTPRTEVMFGPPGHAYVYFIYGMYEMFNIVVSKIDDAQAVLIRAAEPLDGWAADLSGPGKLTRAMAITRRAHKGLDLTGDTLFVMADANDPPRILATPRIGVDYAGEWRHAPLRFIHADSRAVSKTRVAPSGLIQPAKTPRRKP